METSQIQDGGRTPYWKSFFGYNSAPYCPIKTKFGVRRHNRTQTKVRWWKLPISKIQHGGRPLFWKSLYLHISAANRQNFTKFSMQTQIFTPGDGNVTKNSEIRKIKMTDGHRIENHFLAITQLHIVPLRWNLEWGGRITRTWRRSARWSKCLIKKIQNGGRQHFENGYTSVSEPRIVQSWRNMVHKCKFWHIRVNVTNINLKSI